MRDYQVSAEDVSSCIRKKNKNELIDERACNETLSLCFYHADYSVLCPSRQPGAVHQCANEAVEKWRKARGAAREKFASSESEDRGQDAMRPSVEARLSCLTRLRHAAPAITGR